MRFIKGLLKLVLAIVVIVALLCAGLTVANKISEADMHKYIDSFGKVEMDAQLTPELDEYGNWCFVTDGDFKIMQITDVHLGGGCLSRTEDKKAINAVAAMIAYEKPDLVVSTGDMAAAYLNSGTMNNKYAHEYFARLMENLGVYWTVNFGNHDSEIQNTYERGEVAKMYSREANDYKYGLFSAGPEEISGYGNHVINVKNSCGIVTQCLIMMDSHAYTEDDPMGLAWDYDYIKEDQIEWYRGVVNTYSTYNQSVISGLENGADYNEHKTVKSLLFIHIPLIEVHDAYWEYVNNDRQNTENVKFIRGNDGESGQMVCCSKTDTNLFEVMVELGSTKGMFYGHDHLNNFVLEYKGILLCYGYAIDYFAYADIDKWGYQRGCQMIECHGDGSFETRHENYYQDKYVPLYEKEVVDMSVKPEA
jgi:3',5'-cyclic AMP phosphodiesterase CpdA